MHHHMSTEEADFVAEMARGVGPTIACKVFLSIAFQRVVELTKRLVREYWVHLHCPHPRGRENTTDYPGRAGDP